MTEEELQRRKKYYGWNLKENYCTRCWVDIPLGQIIAMCSLCLQQWRKEQEPTL